MLLIDPAEAAVAISASCKGGTATDNDALVLALKYVTPRVERAMNVDTLTRGNYVDSFYIPHKRPETFAHRHDRTTRLRLSNGLLLDGGTVTITDPEGNVLDADDIRTINNELGYVDLQGEMRHHHHGIYTVAYTSGFVIPADPSPLPTPYDPDAKVFEAVPMWIRAICAGLAVTWFRTMLLSPKLPANVKLNAFDQMVTKELSTRIHDRFTRPRADCIWSEGMTVGS